MALALYDRVQETTTTAGTGSITLLGAVPGYQSFAVVGNGNTCYYTIYDSAATTPAWEVGIGTYSTSGPTLARTTVLSNSNGNTSPITLSSTANTKTVWVDYPSEQAVYGNGTTITAPSGALLPVANGGTGVAVSTGANSVVLRDTNVNISANNTFNGITSTTSAAGTTIMTAASSFYQKLTGTTTQTYQLPDATTIPAGATYIFDNDSTGVMTIVNAASGAVDTVQPGSVDYIFLEASGTVAGSWSNYALIPDTYDFSGSTASFGNATITNAVWNGTIIASGYGGTGLTTFTGANNALYSTSSSALTAGTLPVAAGGTGATTLTGYVYGNGTSPMTASTTIPTSALTGNFVTTVSGTANQITASPTTGAVVLSLPSTVTTGAYIATENITGSLTAGAYSYGTLGYSDVNIFASYTSNVNSYNQIVLQNTNSTGNLASADYIVSNNLSSSTTYYGDFGMNGASFSKAIFVGGNGNTAGNTTLTVTSITQGYLPNQLNSLNIYISGVASGYINYQLTSTASPVATTTRASGGASGTNTFVVSSATGIVVGQLVSGTGISSTTWSYVGNVSGTTITLVDAFGTAKNFTANATGTYNFYTQGGVGTYNGSFIAIPNGTTITTDPLAGSFNLPNAVYLTSTSSDLVIGTTTSNAVRFVVNSGATDAAYFSTSGVFTPAKDILVSNYITVGGGAGQNSQNAALGYNALGANTSGSGNVGIGCSPLVSNTSGGQNIGIGYFALGAVTTNGQNIGIGYLAGNATTGFNNTFLGYNSGSSVTTGNYNVIIGSATGAGFGIGTTGSNYVVLSDGAGNTKEWFDPNANEFLNGNYRTNNSLMTVTQTIAASQGGNSQNTMSVGPITINDGISITIADGANWVIV